MADKCSESWVHWISWTVLLFIILCRPRSATLREAKLASLVYEESETFKPSNSAFDASLYYQLTEPYRSHRCRPKRIHLSQAGDSSANGRINMTLSFSLNFQHCLNAIPTVQYGNGSEVHIASISHAQQFNLTSSSTLCVSDWIFHVMLPMITAGEREYWYRIIVEGHVDDFGYIKKDVSRELGERTLSFPSIVGESPTFTFRTPPLPGSPTTIALVGDLGQTFNSTKTMSKILNATRDEYSPISLVLIAGDMSYADSKPKRWESWLEIMEPLLRKVPVHVAAGNHEIECDQVTGDIFVPYENWFRNPNRIGPADMKPVDDNYRKKLWHRSCSTPSEFTGHYNFGNAFYAFQHGLAKIIVLSSYSDTSVGSIQYLWLETELKSLNRSVTPWLIVSFHCPFYTTFKGHVNEIQAIRMKEAMEPLFVKYKVNLVVSGHDHAYMRTFPMANGEPDPSDISPVYTTIGAGGNREGHIKGFRHRHQEAWVAKRDRWEFGYAQLHIPNATHAVLQWVHDRTSRFGVHDNAWLVNQHVNATVAL